MDVLQGCLSSQGTAARAELSRVELLTRKAPKDLFGHTGKVLVEHKGKELLLPEKVLKGHMGHGDHVLDPTGRAAAEQNGS